MKRTLQESYLGGGIWSLTHMGSLACGPFAKERCSYFLINGNYLGHLPMRNPQRTRTVMGSHELAHTCSPTQKERV